MRRRSRAAPIAVAAAAAAAVCPGVGAAAGPPSAAFVVPSTARQQQQRPDVVAARRTKTATSTTTSLRDINEWRDIPFEYAGLDKNPDTMDLSVTGSAPPREICVLPFPYTDVLLQGETKELRLYEDRFLKLFDDAMDRHGGVVAMGLLAESGIIQTVPVCEIEAFNRMGEGFGIFLTIRAVGRARLVELTQQEPYIKAVCLEVSDEVPANLELPTVVAGNIENFMVGISALEHRLKKSSGKRRKMGSDEDDDEDSAEGEMKDRIARAKLEDSFYSESVASKGDDLEDDDDDDDADDDDDDDDRPLDRTARFRLAYDAAKSADSQGYTVSSSTSSSSSSDGKSAPSRSAQDLTALSWAAFCTDPPMDTHGELPVQYVIVDEDGNEVDVDELEDEDGEALMAGVGAPSAKDVMQKIQALDSEDLFERLKLASHMLREKKSLLQDRLERRGLGRKGGDEGESFDEEL